MAEETINQTKTTKEITWQAGEYIHYKRSQDWYWVAGLIAVLGVIIALVFTNFLLVIIIIISTFIVFLLANRPPDEITISITTQGIRIKNSLYLYNDIGSFAIREEEPAKLLIHTSRLIMPNIYIPIENQDPELIKNFLEQYLPEDPYEESLSEKIMESIGF